MKQGDLVLTSGLGGGYPPDLIVGQVVNVRSRDFDLFQQATVQPVVDFNRLEIVLVIVNFKPVDISPLVPDPINECVIWSQLPVILLSCYAAIGDCQPGLFAFRDSRPASGDAGGLGFAGGGQNSLALGCCHGIAGWVCFRHCMVCAGHRLYCMWLCLHKFCRDAFGRPLACHVQSLHFSERSFRSLLSFAVLRFSGVPLPVSDMLGLLTLPGVLLNMLLAIPVYAVMRDLCTMGISVSGG